MFITIFFIGLIILIPMLFIYIRTFSTVVEYAKEQNIDVLGRRYNNVTQLYADIGFLNDLWAGEKIKSVEDNAFKALLNKARRLLITQIILGLGLFVIIILNGVAQ